MVTTPETTTVGLHTANCALQRVGGVRATGESFAWTVAGHRLGHCAALHSAIVRPAFERLQPEHSSWRLSG